VPVTLISPFPASGRIRTDVDDRQPPPHNQSKTPPHPSVLNFIIVPPNPKAKNNGLKLTMVKDKPDVGMIEKDGPLVDSPKPMDLEESQPGGSLQDNPPGVTHAQGESPHCERGLGAHQTDVPPNNDNPFSGL